jgi:flagellar L-ring protein precursor FlgH
MIVEVLPGGVLRIEGERIISVNNEEQIMVISGLARTRDINSENQIDSTRLANMRVDYFGRGAVGSPQFGGWFSNLLRLLWPF